MSRVPTFNSEAFLDLLCSFALDDCRIYDKQTPTLHVIEFRSDTPFELINTFRAEFERSGLRPVSFKNGFAVAIPRKLGRKGSDSDFWVARVSYQVDRSPHSGHRDIVEVNCRPEKAGEINAEAVTAFMALLEVAA